MVEELKKDLEELKLLKEQATRPKIKDIIAVAQHRIETDIINLEIKQRSESAVPAASTAEKKIKQQSNQLIELKNYAWDQSDKFVKIFVTMKDITQADVTTTFTENSMKLIIKNLNDKDYSLTIKNLHSPINEEKSYQKIKTDMVVVFMKKVKDSEVWSHLTVTEKRVKDMKESAFKPEDANSEDPTAGIMNLMKKMYQEGDTETKKMIAKAWTESQEKQRQME